MEDILKNITTLLIGMGKGNKTSSLIEMDNWNTTTLNQYIYSFQKDLLVQQKSYEKSLKKLASKYLYKLKRMQNNFHKNNTHSSEITLFDSLRRLISTYFNTSQSLKNVNKKSLLNLKNKSKSNRKHYVQQLALISNEEREQSDLIKSLHNDVTTKEAEYKHAYEMASEMIKSVQEKNERADNNTNDNDSDCLKLQQHQEHLKLKQSFYLLALKEYNKEIDYYNTIRTKSNLCNYKIFLEDLFNSMKDTINYHQDILNDQIEIYNYLQCELKSILAAVKPIKDAETIFKSICSDITYEHKLDEKLYKDLSFNSIEPNDVMNRDVNDNFISTSLDNEYEYCSTNNIDDISQIL